METMTIFVIYFSLSFVQALLLARGIDKMHKLENPKTDVFLLTIAGVVATVAFFLGLLAGFVEQVVHGE